MDAKISPKTASEKAQATVSENRYTFPKIDVFWTAILSLLAPKGNNVRASFLVHQVPRTSATVLRYRRVFTRPVGSKFEIVRPYKAQSARIMLWGTPTSPPTLIHRPVSHLQNVTAPKMLCCRFEAVVAESQRFCCSIYA